MMRGQMLKALIVALLGIVPLGAEAANWGGTIYVPVTMTKAQSPHYVTSTLTLASGGVLTIEPGCYVYFSSGAALDVSLGKLIADASAGTRIVMGFNGPGGTHGSWPGIRFRCCGYSTQSVMKNVSILYGGTAAEGAIWLDRSRPTINNVSITHSAGPGIFYSYPGQTYTLTKVTAENCLGDGVVASGVAADLLLQTTSIVRNNGGNGVDLRAGAKLRVNGLTSSYNTGWAIGGDPDTVISSLASFTMTGNGGGAKNALGTRGGTLAANVSWTLYSTLPRYVTGVVTVPSGKSLTIPSQTVRFNSGASLDIQGTLTSTGTAASPITLTTAATTPSPGGWDGVRIRSTASTASTLTYTTISYATTGLLIDGYSGTLANTTIASSSLEGIRIQGATARPTFNAVSVNNALTDAILVATGAGATINNPTFAGNQGYPFAVEKATSPLTITGVTPPASGGNFNNAIRMRATSIAADETWLLPPLPWVVTADLTIQNGKVVTLPAGTTIRFASGKVLYAQGTLVANGTATQPVLLTSNQSVPAAGDWGGLSIGYLSYYNVAATLAHTIVEYAGKTTAARPAVSFSSSSPDINSLTVRNSFADGVYVSNSIVTGSRLAVLDSGARSVHAFDTSARVTLPHSRFERNPQGVSGGSNVDLRLSYWGHASGPAGAGPGTGDAVAAGALYEPWLIAAPSTVNYFTAVTSKNRTFNPAVGVVAHIDHAEQLASSWTFNVYNGATLVRTLTGTTPAVEWDGRDAGGTLQPSGTYRWELAANAAGGNATPASGLAILDSARQLIESFAISERYFSPNGDAIKDNTTANGTIGFGDSTWNLKIRKKATGAVVRSTSESTAAISFIWNGKNDAGTQQSDGAYDVELTVTNLATSATETLTVDLDVTPPTATITSPFENAVISNIYTAGTPVRITVQDASPPSWDVKASEGDPPSGFFPIAEGTGLLVDQQVTVWASNYYGAGRWTLRLTVADLAGNQTVTERHIWKRDLEISQTNTSEALVWEFDPDVESMTYRSIVPFSLRETITIRNDAGVVVRTLLSDVLRAEGTYFDTWDGRNDQGQRVPDGAYFYIASVSDGTTSYVWDRSDEFRPEQTVMRVALSSEFAPWDNRPLEVDFENDTPRRIAFQVSSSNPGNFGPYCSGLPSGTQCIEHRYRASGPQKIYFAGTYADGTAFPDASAVRVMSDLFPENAVVVYGSEPGISALEVNPPLMTPARGASLDFVLSVEPGASANVIVRLIRHENAATVRTITQTALTGGSVQIPIDGRSDNGLWIPPGAYTVAITITDTIGNVVTRHALMTARY